jgi:hypothetical protein
MKIIVTEGEAAAVVEVLQGEQEPGEFLQAAVVEAVPGAAVQAGEALDQCPVKK